MLCYSLLNERWVNWVLLYSHYRPSLDYSEIHVFPAMRVLYIVCSAQKKEERKKTLCWTSQNLIALYNSLNGLETVTNLYMVASMV